jgi:hypothetical protein
MHLHYFLITKTYCVQCYLKDVHAMSKDYSTKVVEQASFLGFVVGKILIKNNSDVAVTELKGTLKLQSMEAWKLKGISSCRYFL